MKKVLLRQQAPPVYFTQMEPGSSYEITRTEFNWLGGLGHLGTGVDPTNPATYDVVQLTDYAYQNSPGMFLVITDQTDDRYDLFRGTITLTASVLTADGYLWNALNLSRGRRSLQLTSQTGDFWATFEDPYILPANITRTVNGLMGATTSPYLPGTDVNLIQQPLNVGGFEMSYPKAIFVDGGAGYTLDLLRYAVWPQRVWVRPAGINLGPAPPASTADILIFTF